MSSILETSQPAAEPVSLTEALLFLKLPDSTPDKALIGSLWLPASRRYIESLTGLCLANRSFSQYEERFPVTVWPFYFDHSRAPVTTRQDQRVRLLRSPVTKIAKLTFVGTDGELHSMLPGRDFVVNYSSRPAFITPLAGNDWPALLMGQFWPELFFPSEFWSPSINGLNRIQILFSAGFTVLGTDTEDILPLGAMWQPSQPYVAYAYVLDGQENLQVQLIALGAMSGENPPTFAALGASAADGTCSWFNAGPQGGAYQTGNVYPGPSVVLDGNGNLEFTRLGLTSGGAPPAWSTTPGASTLDNGGAWINLGPPVPIVPITPNPLEPIPAGGPAPPSQLTEYAGLTGIPEDLKMAVLLMLAHLYFNREPVVGGFRGESATDVPHSVTAITNNHRVWDFGPMER